MWEMMVQVKAAPVDRRPDSADAASWPRTCWARSAGTEVRHSTRSAQLPRNSCWRTQQTHIDGGGPSSSSPSSSGIPRARSRRSIRMLSGGASSSSSRYGRAGGLSKLSRLRWPSPLASRRVVGRGGDAGGVRSPSSGGAERKGVSSPSTSSARRGRLARAGPGSSSRLA